LDLKLANDPKRNYIILYRHPLEAITSLYEWYIDSKKLLAEESRETWIKFLGEKIDYWKGFVGKWVIHNTNPNTYYLPYHEFMSDPVERLTQVIKFINPACPIDLPLVKKIVDSHNMRLWRDIRQFRYFDEDTFKKSENSAKREIDMLELNRYFL